MQSKMTKFATAAVIIVAALIGISQFGGSLDGTSVAFAAVKEAVNKMPLMHRLFDTKGDGQQHGTENWYRFDSKSVLVITSSGELSRIYCPFPVILIIKVEDLVVGDVYLVDAVKVSPSLDDVYIISGKAYLVRYYKIFIT